MTQRTIGCVPIDDHRAKLAEELERPGRRQVLRGGAVGIIGGLATMVLSRPAAASCATDGSPCCHLGSCTLCNYSVSRDRYTCPSGYTRTYWSCPSGGVVFICGECSSGSTCYSGPFACSTWYRA